MPNTRFGGTSPSYRQPKETEITPSQRRSCSRAVAIVRSRPESDSSIGRLTFLRLCVSEAERKRLTSSDRSRCASARSKPRSFGDEDGVRHVAGPPDRLQHVPGVGELRDHIRTYEGCDLEPLQPALGEHADEPHLVRGRDHLGLVLEPVARPDLAQANALRPLGHYSVRFASASPDAGRHHGVLRWIRFRPEASVTTDRRSQRATCRLGPGPACGRSH
jgi:hypothetical protein